MCLILWGSTWHSLGHRTTYWHPAPAPAPAPPAGEDEAEGGWEESSLCRGLRLGEQRAGPGAGAGEPRQPVQARSSR